MLSLLVIIRISLYILEVSLRNQSILAAINWSLIFSFRTSVADLAVVEVLNVLVVHVDVEVLVRAVSAPILVIVVNREVVGRSGHHSVQVWSSAHTTRSIVVAFTIGGKVVLSIVLFVIVVIRDLVVVVPARALLLLGGCGSSRQDF